MLVRDQVIRIIGAEAHPGKRALRRAFEVAGIEFMGSAWCEITKNALTELLAASVAACTVAILDRNRQSLIDASDDRSASTTDVSRCREMSIRRRRQFFKCFLKINGDFHLIVQRSPMFPRIGGKRMRSRKGKIA